eukprot:m51a1_g2368 putative 26s proteasome non-atpase regulatory subunit 2 (941) ;mRNA; r:646317-649580
MPEDKKNEAPAKAAQATDAQKKPTKKKGKGKPGEAEEPELSPEDLRIKEEINLAASRVLEGDAGVQLTALNWIRTEIKTGTSSMTSVPKPLKFLRPHYVPLCQFFSKIPSGPNKTILADLLAMLAMTAEEEGKRESLAFKLQGDVRDLESWGHDFVRNIAGEVADEWNHRVSESLPTTDLEPLVDCILPFDMHHNCEPDACDLLMEIGQLDKLLQYVDYATPAKYERVALYLTTCAQLVPDPDDRAMRRVAAEIYRRAGRFPAALVWQLRLRDHEAVAALLRECKDAAVRKQMAFIIARAGIPNAERLISEALPDEPEQAEELAALASNAKLSQMFGTLAQDLGITEARDPEDIYRTGAGPDSQAAAGTIDSARQNLASTFVNAFANAASGRDKYMTPEGSKWVFKNKDQGMMSAAASLGLVTMWEVESLSLIDKYLNSTEPFIKAGGLLGVGLVGCTVRSDIDPVFALVCEHLESKETPVRIGAILALGFAYAGAGREEIKEMLLPILENNDNGIEVQSMAALALGLIFVGAGSASGDIATALVLGIMEAPQVALNSSYIRFVGLALGLLFLGRGDEAEPTIETAKTLPGNAGKYALLSLQTCAYASTGNVLKVQELLQTCGEHAEDPSAAASKAADGAAAPAPAAGAAAAPAGAAPAAGDAAAASAAAAAAPSGPSPKGIAVLGIALIALGEEVGDEMVARMFDHLMQYGDPEVRRAVPLGLALLSVSHPRIPVMDTLSKMSHDGDAEVALNAILALGFISAGTNNSRVAGLLAQLASYYYKNPEMLFVVRLSQGLLHLGKGTMTLAPFHSDRNVMSNHAMAGLLVALHAALDIKNMILGKSHYLLYSIAVSMYPRMLMTLDENLELIKTPVRVGLAVDVAGQAGRPKAITGFQTHTTPVLLAYGERAELATDEYIPLSPYLEGFVILRKNPNATSSE